MEGERRTAKESTCEYEPEDEIVAFREADRVVDTPCEGVERITGWVDWSGHYNYCVMYVDKGWIDGKFDGRWIQEDEYEPWKIGSWRGECVMLDVLCETPNSIPKRKAPSLSYTISQPPSRTHLPSRL